MDDILRRLEHEPSYTEHSDARQLRKDAAEVIRRLRAQVRPCGMICHRAEQNGKACGIDCERDNEVTR